MNLIHFWLLLSVKFIYNEGVAVLGVVEIEQGEALPLGRRARKKIKTRQAIIEAAVRLFREQGYRETSIADIMRAADLGVGTFYNYFATKEDMLFYMLGNLVREVHETLARERQQGTTSLRLLAAGAGVMADFLEQNRYVLPIFLAVAEHGSHMAGQGGRQEPAAGEHPHEQAGMAGPAASSEHSPGFGRLFGEIIAEGQQAGEIRSDVPPAVISEMFHSTFQAAAFSQLPLSFADNVSLKTRLLLDGIRPQHDA